MLGHLDIDTLRDHVGRGRGWPQVLSSEVELGAALEFAVALSRWRSEQPAPPHLKLAESWATHNDTITAALHALQGQPANVALYDAPAQEMLPLGARSALQREGALFFDRLARSLRERAGVAAPKSLAISRAAFEMGDNALQHSGHDEDTPAAGVLGFELRGSKLMFAVADAGRGVLSSLATNEKWRRLATAGEALDAAILQRASRWQHGGGNGFRDLLNALSDHAGRLRFASDDAVLILEGTEGLNAGRRLKRVSTRRSLPGLQLSVYIDVSVMI